MQQVRGKGKIILTENYQIKIKCWNFLVSEIAHVENQVSKKNMNECSYYEKPRYYVEFSTGIEN